MNEQQNEGTREETANMMMMMMMMMMRTTMMMMMRPWRILASLALALALLKNLVDLLKMRVAGFFPSSCNFFFLHFLWVLV